MKTLIESADRYLQEDLEKSARYIAFPVKWDDLTMEAQTKIHEEFLKSGIGSVDEIDYTGEVGDYVIGHVKIYSI